MKGEPSDQRTLTAGLPKGVVIMLLAKTKKYKSAYIRVPDDLAGSLLAGGGLLLLLEGGGLGSVPVSSFSFKLFAKVGTCHLFKLIIFCFRCSSWPNISFLKYITLI